MSEPHPESEQQPERRPGLVERLKRHHDEARHHREEAELESAVGAAGFDLGTDIGRPTLPEHHEAGYDVGADLGVDHESREG